jgi:sugar-specific transcriptional regulator TrmB
MAGTDTDNARLKALVERNRRELEELRGELEQIGEQMRREHIRRARQERGSAAAGREVNRMCRDCFNSCKQPASVRIHHCDRYEPLK